MNNYAIIFRTASGSVVQFQARAHTIAAALRQAGDIDGWTLLELAEYETADGAADFLAAVMPRYEDAR